MIFQKLTDNEQEKCQTSYGLFKVLSEKFKLQHNETISSLQYCKLVREEKESDKERMGYLGVNVNEFNYKERDRRLKHQFINWINADDMMTEIIKELKRLTK